MEFIFTPSQVLSRGFAAYSGLSNNHDGTMNEKDVNMFKKVYGSSPVVVSVLWNDIVTSPTTIFPCNRDISEKGFKKLLIALHFLWAYPKNAEILALAFGVSVRSVQGDNLWNSVLNELHIEHEVTF